MADFLLPEEDATTQEEQLALANALRREQGLGVLGQLTGDKVLGQVGGTLFQGAQAGRALQEQAKARRFQAALQAEAQRREQEYRDQDLALKQQQVDRDRFSFLQGSDDAGKPIVVSGDKKTGKLEASDVGGRIGGGPGAADKEARKSLEEFGNALSTTKGRGNLIAKNRERLLAADRLEASIVDPEGNIQPLSKTFVREAVTNLNSLLGGSQALGQIEELMPKSFGSDVAGFVEYLKGHPQDAQMKPFLEGILHIARREKAVIGAHILNMLREVIPTYAPTIRKYRKEADAILRVHGITPDLYDPETFLPTTEIDPVKASHKATGEHASGGSGDLKARQVARIKALKKQGVADDRIMEILGNEGLGMKGGAK